MAASVVLPQLVGGLAALFTYPAIDSWYAGLEKPLLSPPNWVFGPVWTSLYLLMGIAAYLVWRQVAKKEAKTALIYYCLQLVANFWWSVIFFAGQNIAAAMFEIVVLWLLILLTIVSFARVSRPAAWLLVPYLVWVSFAGYLNYSLLVLNR